MGDDWSAVWKERIYPLWESVSSYSLEFGHSARSKGSEESDVEEDEEVDDSSDNDEANSDTGSEKRS